MHKHNFLTQRYHSQLKTHKPKYFFNDKVFEQIDATNSILVYVN